MQNLLTFKFVAVAFIAIAMIFGAYAVTAPTAQALTLGELVELFISLGIIPADKADAARDALSSQTPDSGDGVSTGFTFTRNHSRGDSGGEVMEIQKFLNAQGHTVASSGAGSPGNETSFFGPATHAAVIAFQNANASDILAPVGLSAGTGYWGPSSRAKANAMNTAPADPADPADPSDPATPGTLQISAAAQPANSLAPYSALRVPFTRLNLTNNSGSTVTVNGVVVERQGLASNTNFDGVVLVDGNNVQLGISRTLNSNNQATVGGTFTIQPGETKTLTVAANMADDSTVSPGEVASFAVVGVNTGATVSGSLPISGASHTVNGTLALGSISTSTSSFNPGGTQNKSIGEMGVRFSGLQFTANSVEDARFFSLRWRQTGTASAADLSNVVTVVNGTEYPTTVDSSGKYYTTVFPGGILIPKGQQADVYIKGDIAGANAADRTVIFDIDRVSDVYFVGQTYGYGLSVDGNLSYTPWFSGNTTNVQAGTVTTIGKASEVPAQNISVNVANQPLGGFVTNFAGEAVSVQTMTMAIATSSASLGGVITDMTIVDANGSVVAGPVDATWSSGNLQAVFADTVTFPVGRAVYTIRGKIPSTATNGATVAVTVTPTNWTNTVGQSSGNNVSITQGAFTLNTMTVRGAALAATISSQPGAQSIVSNVSGHTFANVQLNASDSGEDMRLNSLPLQLDNGTTTHFSTCQLWDGATALNTGSNVPSSVSTGKNTFVFNNSLVVEKGTVKTLALKCDINNGVAGTGYQWGIDTADTFTATGVTSGTSLTVTPAATASAGLMSVADGSLSVVVDASSPSYTVHAGGATGITAGVARLRAENEDMTLNKLGVTLANSDSEPYDSVTKVDIFDGATQVGTVWFTGSNETATSTLSTPITLTKDTDKLLTFKADLVGIGSGQTGVAGKLIKVDPDSAEAVGASSGSTHQVGATAGVAGFRTFRSYPTIAQETLGSTGVADGRLIRFSVTADANGSVGVDQFGFKVSTTSATVTNLQLFAFTDASYSSPVSGQESGGQIGSTVSGVTSGTVFRIAPTTDPLQVPAGSTRYFELRASVAGVQSGSSVVTTVMGDSAFTGMGQGATSGTASSTVNVLWSGNSTSTASKAANDWSNAFGLPGLPASGLIQTRSN